MSANDPPNKTGKPVVPEKPDNLTKAERLLLEAKGLETSKTTVNDALGDEAFATRLIWICRQLAKGSMDPKDLAQDSFLRMLENKEQYQGKSSLEAWARGIAKNRLIDHIRSQNVHSQKVSVPRRTEQSDENVLHKAALREAMGKLTPRQREMLKLKHVNGESVEVIAKKLGFSKTKQVYKELEKIERYLNEAIEELE